MGAMNYFKCDCGGTYIQQTVWKASTNFVVKRSRKCNKCGKIRYTIEIIYDEYKDGVKKLNGIIQLLSE